MLRARGCHRRGAVAGGGASGDVQDSLGDPGLSTRVQVSPVEVPAPSRMKFSGVDEIFS